MNKFTFISTFVPDQLDSCNSSTKITHEFEANTLEEVLHHFEDFLRGSGFSFEGNVEIAQDIIDSDL